MPCGAGILEEQVKPDISYSETGVYRSTGFAYGGRRHAP
jgi:hypothetical protein